MGKLDGQVAIVTGAARGLGRAYARRLATLGARVAVADVDLRSYAEFAGEATAMTADSTGEEINAAGGESIGFELDIADRDAVFAMADSVVAAWGRIDGRARIARLLQLNGRTSTTRAAVSRTRRAIGQPARFQPPSMGITAPVT